ncbi:hypothetical protein ERJ70_04660 [Sediminibacillus dalangtanensis]|uniref:DUF3899 domain-containing protein n=1 Tax=Sediminibacillus dalangtanensis TaxID=2729421 RepID=A0ABX7VRP0_9BACI|nr:hypothetical protein [Sediminibacillus dalangtanensis]QTM98649.1 hypothetical protein ERJ70_04660 [Sediminibacillus dalangtanensis]
MYVFLMISAFIVCIAALIITLRLGKSESDKARVYEKAENRHEQELDRSMDYEKRSMKENVPLLSIIYGATFLIAIALFLIFFYFPF